MSDQLYQTLAVVIYLSIVASIAYFSYKRNISANDFIIGGRGLNYWLTALAAHGSDMGSWIFIGYPMVVFLSGMFNTWVGIGLTLFMFLNWQFIAPRVRIATEQYNSLTFSSFYESRLADTSGLIRVFSSIMCIFYYTIYISAGLIGLGYVAITLFEISYLLGITIGIAIVIPYVFFGGYRTLAWIDLFQGIFLLLVILFVPVYTLVKLGGWTVMINAIDQVQLSTALLPNLKPLTLLTAFFLMTELGLGYFGQPHIVTKFMGIKRVQEIKKSKYIGMTWMVLSLGAATLIGLVGIPFFQESGLANPQEVFIQMVKRSFHPFLIGLFLCAVLAATINTIGSQVLVLASSVTEDLYKRLYRKDASQRTLLVVSRAGVVVTGAIAYMIAFFEVGTVYGVVSYAWAGLGSAFGPLLIFSLYSKKVNKYGGWAGILSGGIVAAIWPSINSLFPLKIPAMLVGFVSSCITIYIVSLATDHLVHQSAKEIP